MENPSSPSSSVSTAFHAQRLRSKYSSSSSSSSSSALLSKAFRPPLSRLQRRIPQASLLSSRLISLPQQSVSSPFAAAMASVAGPLEARPPPFPQQRSESKPLSSQGLQTDISMKHSRTQHFLGGAFGVPCVEGQQGADVELVHSLKAPPLAEAPASDARAVPPPPPAPSESIKREPFSSEAKRGADVEVVHSLKAPPFAEAQASEARAVPPPPPSEGIERESSSAEVLKPSNANPPGLGIGKSAERKDRSIAATVERGNEKSLLERAESVKETAALLEKGERNFQAKVLEEKRVVSGSDAPKTSAKILHYKERLKAEESYLVIVLDELKKTKERIQSHKGDDASLPVSQESLSSSKIPEVLPGASVAEGNGVDVLHEAELVEKEIESALGRLPELESLKQSAMKDCEAAVSIQANESMRVNKLLEKHGHAREFLTALKAALAEVETDISLLRSLPEVDLKGSTELNLAELRPKIGSQKISELIVSEEDLSTEKLIQELSTIRGLKIYKSEAGLIAAKVRLEQAKTIEQEHVRALGSILEQLDETKPKLNKAANEGVSLATKINALQAEISTRQAELEGAQETDQIACATLASLQDELCSIRTKLLAAQGNEVKAREAKRSLPAAVKQLALEADEAKASASVSIEEARKGKLVIEAANASLNTAMKRLEAAQKEAEVARASEAMALAELKALSELGGEPKEETSICIPFEEYRALRDKGLESEASATKKVAAILLQVETVMASRQEAQGKLDYILKELDVMMKAMEEAQKNADDAQAAKLLVEAKLRKWRAEHEQWRRTGSIPSSVSTSAAQSPRFANGKGGQGKLLTQSFHKKAVTHLDGLAEVLSLKVPTSEKAAKVISEMELPQKPGKAKKLSLFTRMLSIMLRKKTKQVR